jgi:HEPN domain-containing protein
MSENEKGSEVQRWLRYALEDLETGEALLNQQTVIPRHICWLAQQSAEKAPKAALIFLQIDFPRRHDLDALRNLLPSGWNIKEEQPDLAALTEWSVEARYPGDWPDATEDDARIAIEQARVVWQLINADLLHHGFLQTGDSGG